MAGQDTKLARGEKRVGLHYTPKCGVHGPETADLRPFSHARFGNFLKTRCELRKSGYLRATDPEVGRRTWQVAMDQMTRQIGRAHV